MDLHDVWPLFGLEIHTPRLTLRPVHDDDLPGLVSAVLEGIHDPDRVPFSSDWTNASPDVLRINMAKYQWSLRQQLSAENWTVPFAVREGKDIIGVQDLAAFDFANRRTVNSGSWLTARAQGRGIGTEMRAAILLFSFDVLGAQWAESGAASWNAASLSVSRKLGYRPNGTRRVSPRPGESTEEQRVRLLREDFRRPSWDIQVSGTVPALAQLGIEEPAG